MEMDKTAQALLYLMGCALHNAVPKAVDDLDYEQLYKLSVTHSVVAMTAMALESGGFLTEPYASAECIKKWKDAKVKAVRKTILLDAEREQILHYFEKAGIWYLPLKGCVLKDLYPKLGMRQMSDNDILFDRAFQPDLKDFMESRGYKTVLYARGNHDTYEKEPVYNYEFHTALFGQAGEPAWISYYENVKDRLQKDPDNSYGYHFRDEDFYIYFMVHTYKHYRRSGSGVRTLADVYVYLNAKASSFDWTYIENELTALGIGAFEEKVRTLAEKMFPRAGTPVLTDNENEMLAYFVGSGTYGSIENRVKNDLAKLQSDNRPISPRTKLRYLISRLFPDKEVIKRNSPFCARHPWSVPFFRVYRLVRAAIFGRKRIRAEIAGIKQAK